jgi:hypothetical protein
VGTEPVPSALAVQEYSQIRAEMTQSASSLRAFAATTMSAAVAILVFLLKAIFDLKPDSPDDADVARTRQIARTLATLGIASIAALSAILIYALVEWHIGIFRQGSYLRVFFEERPGALALRGDAGWLARSRDIAASWERATR